MQGEYGCLKFLCYSLSTPYFPMQLHYSTFTPTRTIWELCTLQYWFGSKRTRTRRSIPSAIYRRGERDKLCCTTAFFLLPSCGRSLYHSVFYKLFLQIRVKKFNYNDFRAVIKTDSQRPILIFMVWGFTKGDIRKNHPLSRLRKEVRTWTNLIVPNGKSVVLLMAFASGRWRMKLWTPTGTQSSGNYAKLPFPIVLISMYSAIRRSSSENLNFTLILPFS